MRRKYNITPVCDRCGVRKEIAGNEEIPPMVGFTFEDGSILNLCCDCIQRLGEILNEGNEEAYTDFWNEIRMDHPDLFIDCEDF